MDDPFEAVACPPVVDDPFEARLVVDNPFDLPPSTFDDPFDQPPSNVDDPFDQPLPAVDDPFDQPPPAVDDPFDQPPPAVDDPFDQPPKPVDQPLKPVKDPSRGEKRQREEEETIADRWFRELRQQRLEEEAQIKASDLTLVDYPDRSDEKIDWVLNDVYDDVSNPSLDNTQRQKANEALVDRFPLSTMAPLISDTFELLIRNNTEMYQPLAQGEPIDQPEADRESELRKIAVYRPSHIARLLVCSGPALSPCTPNLTIFLRPCSRGQDCIGRHFFDKPMMHSLSPSNLDTLLSTGRYEQEYHSLCELCNWDCIGSVLMDSATDVPIVDKLYRHRIYLSNYGVAVADGPDSYDPAFCLLPESSASSSSVGTKAVSSGFNGLIHPMPCFNAEWLRKEFDPVMKVERLNHDAMLFRQSAVQEVSRGSTTRVLDCSRNDH